MSESPGEWEQRMRKVDERCRHAEEAEQAAIAAADISKRTPGQIRYTGDWLETADGHLVTMEYTARDGQPNLPHIATLNDGEYIEYPDAAIQHANGKFLALAWNTHDALVEALRDILLDAEGDLTMMRNESSCAEIVADKARAALALVDAEKEGAQ